MVWRIPVQSFGSRIRWPRTAAFAVALGALLLAHPVFAQHCAGGGGGGRGGHSGGAGGGGQGGGGGLAGFGGFGGFGGAGGGVGGGGGTGGQAGQGALFNIPMANLMDGDMPQAFDRQQYLAERRAFRAEQAERRELRLARKRAPRNRLESPVAARN